MSVNSNNHQVGLALIVRYLHYRSSSLLRVFLLILVPLTIIIFQCRPLSASSLNASCLSASPDCLPLNCLPAGCLLRYLPLNCLLFLECVPPNFSTL